MEACEAAHHGMGFCRAWPRMAAHGRAARLINPRFVKPFVRGSKNDTMDAEAIFDAASRPTMRFVPVKSTEQQDLQSLHRVRDRLVSQRRQHAADRLDPICCTLNMLHADRR